MPNEERPLSAFRTLADLAIRINEATDLSVAIDCVNTAARALGWSASRLAFGADSRVEDRSEDGETAVAVECDGERLGTLFVLASASAAPVDADAALRALAASAAIAIRLSRMHAMLEAQAHIDQTTGLFNRRGFDAALRREVERVYRTSNPLSTIVIDLDRFRRVAESLGQAHVDATLQAVADILRSGLRQADIAARLGDNQFRILLPGTPPSGARDVAERLRCSIAAANFPVVGTLTATLGIAALPEHAANGAGLLQAAEAAMQTGKRRGRNCVSLAVPLRT